MSGLETTTLRWGIVGAGKISACFAKDLLVDPKTRDASDVQHQLVAVASRSREKAQEFIDANAKGVSVTAHGSYEALYADSNVDAVYIGTPHTYHYENALDAIHARKHVLCEKPATSNAAEVKSLIAAAQKTGVFFMEAMWTRFQPVAKAVKQVIDEGSLGNPVVLHADLSGDFDIHNISKEHRILDPKLGGGALLDLGPYPLVWAIIALYEHPLNRNFPPFDISSSMIKTPLTNVDCNTSFTLNFPNLDAQAILSCSINIGPFNPGVTIRFEKGAIEIPHPIYCPKRFTVRRNGEPEATEERIVKFEGGGWHFQADEVARCVRDGKLQSDLWGHAKTVLAMEIFDEVRKQGGYVLPPGVEKVVDEISAEDDVEAS